MIAIQCKNSYEDCESYFSKQIFLLDHQFGESCHPQYNQQTLMLSHSMIPKILLPLLLALSPLSALADSSIQTDCRMRGMYTNDTYGFSVIIPLNHVACPNTPLGTNDHGLVVELSEDWLRNIEAYAGHNSSEYVDLHDVAEGSKDLLGEDLPQNAVTELSRSNTHLGGLPAVRIVLRFPGGENGGAMIQDEISALRQVVPGATLPSHLYALRLTTLENRYTEDRKVFEKMLTSWHELDVDPLVPNIPPAAQSSPQKSGSVR